MKRPLSVGVWTFGMGSERYVDKGYKPYLAFDERVKRIAELPGVSGIELTFPGDVNAHNLNLVKSMLGSYGLQVAALGVELVCDAEWQTGSFASDDPERRQRAITLTKEGMEVAQALGVDVVSLWLGQDGFDYVFQADYARAWRSLVTGIKECAEFLPRVKLAIEYKTSEPKMMCYVNSGGKALALAQATGCENVGVNLDIGHAFIGRENPAEVASVLLSENRLFHLHLNDNYGIADDDMPVGAVHWPQLIELFYRLESLAYDGWYSLDLYPYRDDSWEACAASITFIQQVCDLVEDPSFAEELHKQQGGAPSKVLHWLYKKALMH